MRLRRNFRQTRRHFQHGGTKRANGDLSQAEYDLLAQCEDDLQRSREGLRTCHCTAVFSICEFAVCGFHHFDYLVCERSLHLRVYLRECCSIV